MAPSCSATYDLTAQPISHQCRSTCANVSFTVDSVACAPTGVEGECKISYSVTRTNPDSTTDVVTGSVTVTSGGCETVDLKCADDSPCIHSKLQLCCE